MQRRYRPSAVVRKGKWLHPKCRGAWPPTLSTCNFAFIDNSSGGKKAQKLLATQKNVALCDSREMEAFNMQPLCGDCRFFICRFDFFFVLSTYIYANRKIIICMLHKMGVKYNWARLNHMVSGSLSTMLSKLLINIRNDRSQTTTGRLILSKY